MDFSIYCAASKKLSVSEREVVNTEVEAGTDSDDAALFAFSILDTTILVSA